MGVDKEANVIVGNEAEFVSVDEICISAVRTILSTSNFLAISFSKLLCSPVNLGISEVPQELRFKT